MAKRNQTQFNEVPPRRLVFLEGLFFEYLSGLAFAAPIFSSLLRLCLSDFEFRHDYGKAFDNEKKTAYRDDHRNRCRRLVFKRRTFHQKLANAPLIFLMSHMDSIAHACLLGLR